MSSFKEPATYAAVPHSDAALDALLGSTAGPIVIIASTEDCYPCAMIKPIVRKLAVEFRGRLTLVETDSESTPAFLEAHGVRSYPTVLLVRDGSLQEVEVGFVDAEQTRALVARFIGVEAEAEKAPSAAERAFRAKFAEATASIDTFMQPASDALAPHYEAAQPALEVLQQQRNANIALGMTSHEAHAIWLAGQKALFAPFADKVEALGAAQAEALLAYSRRMDQSIQEFALASARDKPSLICSPDGSVCHFPDPEGQLEIKHIRPAAHDAYLSALRRPRGRPTVGNADDQGAHPAIERQGTEPNLHVRFDRSLLKAVIPLSANFSHWFWLGVRQSFCDASHRPSDEHFDS